MNEEQVASPAAKGPAIELIPRNDPRPTLTDSL